MKEVGMVSRAWLEISRWTSEVISWAKVGSDVSLRSNGDCAAMMREMTLLNDSRASKHGQEEIMMG